MQDLIEILKAEHRNIGAILGRVEELGIHTEEGRKALMSAKTGLLAHLAREDEHLYPPLMKAAEEDDILRDALEFFTDDIASLAEAALAFFEKYEADGKHPDFEADFEFLVGALVQRIQKEESVIYRMYERL